MACERMRYPVRPVPRALVVLEGGRRFAELRARATKLRATSFTTFLPFIGELRTRLGRPALPDTNTRPALRSKIDH